MIRLRQIVCYIVLSMIVLSCGKESDPLPDQTGGPTACFTFPATVAKNEQIYFNAGCSVDAVSYQWDFGDGGTSTLPLPSHTYTTSGTFNVKLTVKDIDNKVNSITNQVIVSAQSVFYHSGNITTSETWVKGIHILYGYVVVHDATLTIEPGAIVKFTSGAGLKMGTVAGTSLATLIANGTTSDPILFTADSNTPTAGFWSNIVFGSGDSGNSSLKYCTIEYGGESAVYIMDTEVTIENTTIQKSAGYGVITSGEGQFKSFTKNMIKDCPQGYMSLPPYAVPSIGINNDFTGGSIEVGSGNIDTPSPVWKKLNCAYHLNSEIYVGSSTGTTWTISPGSVIKFNNNTSITIGGSSNSLATLIAVGTSAEPIIFTSAKATPGAGDWKSILFGPGTQVASSLDYCTIQYGGINDTYGGAGLINMQGSQVSITNSTFQYTVENAITLDDASGFKTFTNNTINVPGKRGIEIFGNWVHTIGAGNVFTADKGILVQRDNITNTATWLKQPVPYILEGTIEIYSTAGNTLTISAGTTILVGGGHRIWVSPYGKGGLIANGTANEPITFSSAKLTPAAGDWAGIRFNSQTVAGSLLNNCIIEYAGYDGTSYGVVHVEYTNIPSLTNNTLRKSDTHGITLKSANPTVTGNTFSELIGDNIYVSQ